MIMPKFKANALFHSVIDIYFKMKPPKEMCCHKPPLKFTSLIPFSLMCYRKSFDFKYEKNLLKTLGFFLNICTDFVFKFVKMMLVCVLKIDLDVCFSYHYSLLYACVEKKIIKPLRIQELDRNQKLGIHFLRCCWMWETD